MVYNKAPKTFSSFSEWLSWKDYSAHVWIPHFFQACVICFFHYFKHIFLIFTATGNVFDIIHPPLHFLCYFLSSLFFHNFLSCALQVFELLPRHTWVWNHLQEYGQPLRTCIPEGDQSLLKQSSDINGFSDGAELLKSMLGI